MAQAVQSGRFTSSGKPIYVSSSSIKKKEEEPKKSSSKSSDVSKALTKEAQKKYEDLQTKKLTVSTPSTGVKKEVSTPTPSTTPVFSTTPVNVDRRQSSQYVFTGAEPVKQEEPKPEIKSVNKLPQSNQYRFGSNQQQVNQMVSNVEKKNTGSKKIDFNSIKNFTAKTSNAFVDTMTLGATSKLRETVGKNPVTKAISESIIEEVKSPSTAIFGTLAVATALSPIPGDEIVGGGLYAGKVVIGSAVRLGVKALKTGRNIFGMYSVAQAGVESFKREESYSAPKDIQKFRQDESMFIKSVEEARKSTFILTSPERQQSKNALFDTPFPQSVPFVGGTSLRQQGVELPVLGLFSKGATSKVEKETKERLIKEGVPTNEAELLAKSGASYLKQESKGDIFGTIAELSGNIAMRGLMRPVAYTGEIAIETLSKGKFFTKNLLRTGVASVGETAPAIAIQESRIDTGKLSLLDKSLIGSLGAVSSIGTNALIFKGVTSNSKGLINTGVILGNILDPVEGPLDLIDSFLLKIRKAKDVSFITNVNKQGDISTVNLGRNQRVELGDGNLRVITANNPTSIFTSVNTQKDNKNINIPPRSSFDSLIKDMNTLPRKTKISSDTNLKTFDNIVSESRGIPSSDRVIIPTDTNIKSPIQNNVNTNTNTNINNINSMINNNIQTNMNTQTVPTIVPTSVPLTLRVPTIINTGKIIPPLPLALPNFGNGFGLGGGGSKRKTFVNELAFSLSQFNRGLNLGTSFVQGKPLKKKAKKSKPKKVLKKRRKK